MSDPDTDRHQIDADPQHLRTLLGFHLSCNVNIAGCRGCSPFSDEPGGHSHQIYQRLPQGKAGAFGHGQIRLSIWIQAIRRKGTYISFFSF